MIVDKVLTLSSAVIQNSSGKILLLQRSSKASFPNHWQLVEGKIEEDELPRDALRREIQEEINAGIKRSSFVSVTHAITQAKGTNYLVVRILFLVKLLSLKITLSDEHVNFGWFSEKEIAKLELLPGVEEALKKAVSD